MPVFTSSIEVTADYPTIKPSLNLNFDRSRAMDPRISFGRTHDSGVVAATYIGRDGQVKRAGVNEPRFEHDYDTGESLGLLIEEERTNFCGDAIPSVADWTKLNNGTISFGFPAPDGTNTACRYVGSSTSPASLLRVGIPAFTPNGTDTYTISFWVKQVVANTQGGQNLVCDLHDGGPTINYTSLVVQDKWVRVVKQGIPPNSQRTFFDLISNTLNDGTYDFWGLQIEKGTYATSLILTTDSTIGTRGQDSTKIVGEEFKKVFDTSFSEFSVVMDYDNIETKSSGSSNGLFLLWGESTNFDNRLSISSDNDTVNTAVRVRAFGGGSAIFSNNDGVAASSQAATQKLAFSFSVPNYEASGTRKWAFSFSGEAVDLITNNNGSTVPAWTRLGIGINPTRDDESGGKLHVKRLAIYPKALTDAQLQLLTS